jgi:DNA-directed RNA polymerases I, II, and III subunit RPABC4
MRADGARPVHLLLPRQSARACRCGSCGDTVDMGKDDQVRCRTCGHRILYKTRLKRAVQYEAR